MLSKSCFHSLQCSARVRNFTLMLRTAQQRQPRLTLYSETREALVALCSRHQLQPYVTIALHSTTTTTTSEDNGISIVRAKEEGNMPMEQLLRRCANRVKEDPSTRIHSSTVSELWNAYNALTRKLSLEEYDALILVLHHRTRETKLSVNWSRIITIYQDAVIRDGLTPTVSMVRAAIQAYGRTWKYPEAKAAFDTLTAPDKDDYLSLMTAATQSGKIECAFEVLKESIDQGTATGHLLERFVDGSLKRGSLRKAMDAVRMVDRECWSDTVVSRLSMGYTNMMTANMDDSLAILQSMDWRNPEWLEAFSVAFAQRIPASNGHQGMVAVPPEQKALFTVQQLDTFLSIWLDRQPDLTATDTTYNIMLDLHASQGNFAKVKQILSIMQHRRVLPTAPTVGILVRAFGDILPVRDIQTLYHTLRTVQGFDATSYNAFLCSFAAAKSPERALHVARDMTRQGLAVETRSLCAIVQSFAACGRLDDAARWLNRRCKPTWKGDALDPYGILMEGWLQEGEWSKCVRQTRALKSGPCGSAAATHRRIVKASIMALCANQQWRQCEQTLSECQINVTPVTVARMLHTLLKIKRGPEYLVSSATVSKALEIMERTLDVRLQPRGLCQVIEALGERGQVDEAYTFYKRARGEVGTAQEREIRTQDWLQMKRDWSAICRTMIEVAISNNDIHKAQRVWHDLKRCGRVDQKPSLSAYNILLNVYASRQPQPKLNAIRKTFQHILHHNLTPDLVTYNTLIKAFIHADHHQEATDVFKNLLGAGITPDTQTVNTILQSWISRRDWRGVEQFIKSLREQYKTLSLDTITLNLLIRGFLHLDHRTLRHIQLLKAQGKHIHAKHMEKEYWHTDPYPLSSDTIWDIFEAVTGHSRKQVMVMTRHRRQPEGVTRYIQEGNAYEGACRGIVDLIQERAEQMKPSSKATTHATFVSMFLPPKGVRPDAITYRLFIKAFSEAGDKRSADTIQRYWNLV